MTRALTLALIVACNTAPIDYQLAQAPGARAPFAGPTDTSCVGRGETDTVIDGFFFCAEVEGINKIPVDDPIFVPCRDVDSDDVKVLSVFDGITARAYATDKLVRRELVNDQWGDEPLLIDF